MFTCRVSCPKFMHNALHHNFGSPQMPYGMSTDKKAQFVHSLGDMLLSTRCFMVCLDYWWHRCDFITLHD